MKSIEKKRGGKGMCIQARETDKKAGNSNKTTASTERRKEGRKEEGTRKMTKQPVLIHYTHTSPHTCK